MAKKPVKKSKAVDKPKRKYVRKTKPEAKPVSSEHLKKPEPPKATNKLTPYPQSIDAMAFLTDAIAFFRGAGDKAKIVHDAYEALGYGLGIWMPDASTGEFPVRFTAPQNFSGLSNPDSAAFIERQISLKGAIGDHILELVIEAALKIIHQWFGF